MEDISLHILDIAENSIRAGATRIYVRLEEKTAGSLLALSIRDNGDGMDRDTLEKVRSPFFSTKEGKSFGLGLSLLEQAAVETEGDFRISSSPGEGTDIEALFNIGHPDMKPLGDIDLTMEMLRLSHPEIDFQYEYVSDSV